MKNNDCKRLRAAPACVAALVVILCSTAAFAQTLNLMAPAIANVSGTLTARFGVTVVEKPVLKGELEDGAELVLKCDVDLYEVTDYWMDSRIASSTFESTIKYDSLAQEFVMTIPGQDSPLRNKNLPDLLKDGWGNIEASLGPWSMLERGEKYSLRLQTTMNEVDAPSGISRFLYFWSWDTGADNTFQLNFTY